MHLDEQNGSYAYASYVIKEEDVGAYGYSGVTVFMVAVMNDRIEHVKLMLKCAGSVVNLRHLLCAKDINPLSDGCNPLMISLMEDQYDMTCVLLSLEHTCPLTRDQREALVNDQLMMRDNSARTTLMYAVSRPWKLTLINVILCSSPKLREAKKLISDATDDKGRTAIRYIIKMIQMGRSGRHERHDLEASLHILQSGFNMTMQ